MRRIRWAERARRDLAGIDHYLTTHDPVAAVRILEAIKARLRLLTDFPEIGPAVQGGMRRLTISRTDYILFHRFIRNDIYVVSIRHVREDWASNAGIS